MMSFKQFNESDSPWGKQNWQHTSITQSINITLDISITGNFTCRCDYTDTHTNHQAGRVSSEHQDLVYRPRSSELGQQLSLLRRVRSEYGGEFWTLVQRLLLSPGSILVGNKRLNSLSKSA